MNDWPFRDPPNTATLTTREILEGHVPILLVTHDADDGSWQFLPGSTVSPDEGRVVGLGRMCLLDASIPELATYPKVGRRRASVATAPGTGSPSSVHVSVDHLQRYCMAETRR